MKFKNLKLLIIAAFMAFGLMSFINFSNTVKANPEDNIIETINDYKTWKQVQKPEVKKETEVGTPDVLSISDSTISG